MMSRILLRPTCLLLLAQLALACEWTCGYPHDGVCIACEDGTSWLGSGSEVFVLAEEKLDHDYEGARGSVPAPQNSAANPTARS